MRALLLCVIVAACGGAGELTPPPAPFRPEAEPAEAPKSTQKDCDPIESKDELKSISFDERSIPESSRLAEQARGQLVIAGTAEVDRVTREGAITQAVEDLITALKADPYNVAAHYYLAGAYARISRPQCAINLLTRLLQLRAHVTKKAEVDKHIDRLLGRKQALDPDFASMRRDERFRLLVQKMCDGTNDPNCVYGSQKENRER